MADVSSKGEFEVHVGRVNQLDALRLDEELCNLLLEHAKSAFRYYPASAVDAITPELQALLRTFLFSNTIAIHRPSPGNDYENLRYRSDLPSQQRAIRFGTEGSDLRRIQTFFYFVLSIAVPYFWERLRRHATDQEWAYDAPLSWRNIVWRSMNAAEAVFRFASVFNLFSFITYGKYRSLVDRIIGASLVYRNLEETRRPTFEVLNRQLVWQGLAEFLLFLAPLISTLRQPRILFRTRALRRLLPAGTTRDDASSARSAGQGTVSSSTNKCQICETSSMVMPHVALPCRHTFCYTCVAMALEADPSYKCDSCNMAIHTLQRVTSTE